MKTAEINLGETRREKHFGKRREENEESSGLFGSIRRALGTALALFQSRLELITLELREEKQRAMSVVGWGVALVFLSLMAVIAIMAVVVFLLWENALAVLIGFSAFFLVAALASFFVMSATLKKIPFGDTVAQLKKDRDMVTGEVD
ncbi:MAG: phage holin family protein [Verrucomicrobiota bacterium]